MDTTEPKVDPVSEIPEPYAMFASLISDVSSGSSALVGILILELVRNGTLDRGQMLKTLRSFVSPETEISPHIRGMFLQVANTVDTYGEFAAPENSARKV